MLTERPQASLRKLVPGTYARKKTVPGTLVDTIARSDPANKIDYRYFIICACIYMKGVCAWSSAGSCLFIFVHVLAGRPTGKLNAGCASYFSIVP